MANSGGSKQDGGECTVDKSHVGCNKRGQFLHGPLTARAPKSKFRLDASNALVQMFFAVEPIRRYFIQNVHRGWCHASYGNLYTEFIHLAERPTGAWNCDGGLLVVLKEQSAVYGAQLEELIQEEDEKIDESNKMDRRCKDAQSLLDERFNDWKEEASTVTHTGPLPRVQSAAEAWSHHVNLVDNTQLCELLLIQMEIKRHFPECGHIHIQWRHVMHINVALEPGHNLTFTSTEGEPPRVDGSVSLSEHLQALSDCVSAL